MWFSRRATGRSIPELFAARGEAGFRELERVAVARALAGHDGVVALGGGAVEHPSTRAALAGHPVVFLSAEPATALRRVAAGGPDRPLLAGDAAGRLHTLIGRRRPLYASVAAFTVATDAREAAEVASIVAAWIATAPRSTGSGGTRSAGRTRL